MSLSELLRVFEISRKPCSRIETRRCHVIFTFAPKSRFLYTYFFHVEFQDNLLEAGRCFFATCT